MNNKEAFENLAHDIFDGCITACLSPTHDFDMGDAIDKLWQACTAHHEAEQAKLKEELLINLNKLIDITSSRDNLEAERNALLSAIAEHVTVRGEYLEKLNKALAVITEKDEALSLLIGTQTKEDVEQNGISTPSMQAILAGIEALAIAPKCRLVEVGYATDMSILNLKNGNDVIVGSKNDLRDTPLYTIEKGE
jgi:hypothetical protein